MQTIKINISGRYVSAPINGMAVVSAPAEIDVTTEQLRMVRRA
jgi:hypothetical protein